MTGEKDAKKLVSVRILFHRTAQRLPMTRTPLSTEDYSHDDLHWTTNPHSPVSNSAPTVNCQKPADSLSDTLLGYHDKQRGNMMGSVEMRVSNNVNGHTSLKDMVHQKLEITPWGVL